MKVLILYKLDGINAKAIENGIKSANTLNLLPNRVAILPVSLNPIVMVIKFQRIIEISILSANFGIFFLIDV